MAVLDVPAALVHNQFFDEFTEKVRVKPIPWEGYTRAGLVSSSEMSELKQLQKEQEQDDPPTAAPHVELLLGLTSKLSSIDALQYLAVAIDGLVETDPQAAARFRELREATLAAMFRCTEKKDDYLGLKACKVLAGLELDLTRAELGRVFGFVEQCMRSELTSVVDVALQVVQALLGRREARVALWEETRCLGQMVDVLKQTVGSRTAARGVVAVSQTQYEVIFCLWLLTFDKSVARELEHRYDVVATMVEIARAAVKEKVIRVIVLALANMVDGKRTARANIPYMLVARVPACLATLSGRHFKDADLRDALKSLQERLSELAGVVTTWGEYENEVMSGKLHWSAVHRSEEFWKLHIAKMDADDHRIVRQLALILADPSKTATELAVACHDLGQYVKHNPDGKKLLARTGAKARIMGLMTSESPEVRYEALLCVQQIMLNAWRN
ncbi:H(+)-transporting V1 sector ATPase subunit H [Coemansia sp. RSA 552]|nr:H(+)-transporting V1 sector ATPase subunit H [Coemansia sp. RSA 552]